MNSSLQQMLVARKYQDDLTYQPVIFRLAIQDDKKKLEELLAENNAIKVFDTLHDQLKELIKIQHPSERLSPDAIAELIKKHLQQTSISEYGAWIYYPWSEKLIHVLDKDEFIAVRTNRNMYKITPEERDILSGKKIGIIGLSVGQSIALTLAMERVGGELRLADFDTLELSNYNRIRTGLSNLGTLKTIAAAREIAAIDPYLKITCFNEGITENNLEAFLTDNGKLDLLIEECDGLDVKILARYKSKELHIPVIMHTTDSGMIDIERFDIEIDRPILHGLANDLNLKSLKNLTNEEKVPYVLKIVGAESISTRGKASLFEINQTLNTWPQLASAVVSGGGDMTTIARRILLDQLQISGRFYIDSENIIHDNISPLIYHEELIPPLLSENELIKIADAFFTDNNIRQYDNISIEKITELVKAACLAPSGGNVQPWKWLWRNHLLFLFIEEHYSVSLLDFQKRGSYIGLGAAIENLQLKAATQNLSCSIKYLPYSKDNRLIAVISLSEKENNIDTRNHNYKFELEPFINIRCTNRKNSFYKKIPEEKLEELKKVASIDGVMGLHFINTEDTIKETGILLGQADKIRMLHPRGHHDAFFHEMRWTLEENLKYKDGIDVATLELKNSDISVLQIAKDYHAIKFLKDHKLGKGLEKLTRDSIISASAIGLITIPEKNPYNFILAGSALQRIWLASTKSELAFQPVSVVLFLIDRVKSGDSKGFYQNEIDELMQIDKELNKIFKLNNANEKCFLFRLNYAESPAVKSLRRDLNEMFFIK